MKKIQLFMLALCALVSMAFTAPAKVVGYFPYWAQYSQFYPKDVRFQTVSHIHYASLSPSSDGSLAFADEGDKANFEDLAKLSSANGVKLVAVIGGMEAETNLRAIAADARLRSRFAEQAKQWVAQYGLAGVELDWQNLAAGEGEQFASLLGELREALGEEAVLSAAVYPLASADAYPVLALNKLSYVTVFLGDQMSDSESSLKPNLSGQDLRKALDGLVRKGVDSKLLVPVMLLYGKSFAGATGLGSSHQGIGSGSDGILPWRELMEKFDTPQYQVSFDEASLSEVAVSSSEAIVFTGIPSVQAMAKTVKTEGFGGLAFYDLSQDHGEPMVSLLVTAGKVLRPDADYKKKKR